MDDNVGSIPSLSCLSDYDVFSLCCYLSDHPVCLSVCAVCSVLVWLMVIMWAVSHLCVVVERSLSEEARKQSETHRDSCWWWDEANVDTAGDKYITRLLQLLSSYSCYHMAVVVIQLLSFGWCCHNAAPAVVIWILLLYSCSSCWYHTCYICCWLAVVIIKLLQLLP